MSMTLRNPDLMFASIKEVDGNSISLRADHLERETRGQILCAEVGAYVNCGGNQGNTICTINKVQIVEIEKNKKSADGSIELFTEERKVVTLSVIGCALKYQRKRFQLFMIEFPPFMTE